MNTILRSMGAALIVAALLVSGTAPAAEKAETEGEAEKAPKPAAPLGPEDDFDRGVPRTSVEGFLAAANANDWERAAEYLRYETTPDQIRCILVEIRAILYAHPRFDPDPARIRFVGFGEWSLDLEVFAYVDTHDFGEYLEIAEDLNPRIMDAVLGASSTCRPFRPAPSRSFRVRSPTRPKDLRRPTMRPRAEPASLRRAGYGAASMLG